MISPPPASYGGSSRRIRYSRSPSGGGVPPSKRSKPSNSSDPYDRDRGSKSDEPRLYTSICVKNINPKISDLDIRDLCNKKFSKYGTNSVKIYHRNQERVAFVNFTNCEDARKARHAKTGLVWENMQVLLEPVYYRKTVPAEQPIKPGSPRERSPPARRQRRPSPPSPSPPPPPPPVRNRSHHQSSSRHQRISSPPNSSPPSRSSRAPRRPYSPYIPLPPDLVDYVGKKSSSRQGQRSSPSPVRRHQQKQTAKQQRSRSPVNHRSPSASPVRRTNLDTEPNGQQEPTRTLFVGNLDRDIAESKLKEIFGRYGTIEEIDLKKPASSSKRPYAFIQYENMDMAYDARRAMDGQLIGKAECKIGYGKIVPTKYLWVGNIPIDIKRRDLEYAFSRYGQIKTLDYSTGDPTAIITYIDIEDAIKARSKLSGTIQLIDGRIMRNESDISPSSQRGFRIDYLDRPTSRRFVIVRPQQKTSNERESRSSSPSHSHSHHSSPASSIQNHARSPSNDDNNNNEEVENNLIEDVKPETHSRSPTPPPIKQRRSTDHSESSLLVNLSPPIAGRTFYGPLGSYLSSKDTANVNNINELMILCEQLNSSATKSNTALATVYPVQFILKSHAYDARMHFLAGSPTLASILLGQPGDLVAAKTELKITQRLRLDQHKLEDLERTLRTSVTNALSLTNNNSHMNLNNHLSNSLTLINNRKQLTISNQTKFALLITSPKIHFLNESLNPTKQKVKNERTSPHSLNGNDEHLQIKKEITDDDESLLSHLISYLSEKEAAGVISIPFYPTYHNDHSSRQETAVLHIFPSCQFSKKLLKSICPTINFLNDSQTSSIINDEHLMVIIVHND